MQGKELLGSRKTSSPAAVLLPLKVENQPIQAPLKTYHLSSFYICMLVVLLITSACFLSHRDRGEINSMNFVKHARVPRDMQHKYLIIFYIIPSTCFVPGMEEKDRCIWLAHIDISFKIKSDFIESNSSDFEKRVYIFFKKRLLLFSCPHECFVWYLCFYYLFP